MENKKALENFRVLQFASPHPALAAAAAAAAGAPSYADQQPIALVPATAAGAAGAPAAAGPHLVPDHDRVIVHFDVDCFYAQVEECRNPSLRGQPLAVTQKYLVVTANYPARAAGVTKLMGIADAKKACPHLVLVPGEDLTPYRAASRDIRTVLSRWGPLQKLGLDECWVDITQEVQRRVASASSSSSSSSTPWCGHLIDSNLQLTAASKHRPMDLRVVQEGQQQQQQGQQHQQQDWQQQELCQQADQDRGHQQHQLQHQHCWQQQQADEGALQRIGNAQTNAAAAASHHDDSAAATAGRGSAHVMNADVSGSPAWLPACELRLRLGAVVAAEMRQAVKQETGFRCSAGVSCSKLLSKLVSGLHKPDDQTVILPTQAQAFAAPLPVRALPGVGYKADGLLKSWGVSTVSEACVLSKQQLIQGLGERPGVALYLACRGVDPSPVIASGPPKSITVEDSFKSCTSWHSLAQVLQVLVPDLLDRLQEDLEEFPHLQRTPSTLTVKWRKASTGWARSSASAPWPAAARLTAGPQPGSTTVQQHQHHQQQQQQQYFSGPQAAPQQQRTPGDKAAGAVKALTAAATSLLKQHLPAAGFSLTLLNIGATGFKARSDTAGSIQQFLMPRPHTVQQLVQQAAAAAPADAVAGGLAGAGAGAVGPNLLQQAKAATEARRDYSRADRSTSNSLPWSPQQAGLGPLSGSPQQGTGQSSEGGQMLSKRQERRLWELAMQQQQHQQQQDQQQQQQQQQCARGALSWQQQQQQHNILQPVSSKPCVSFQGLSSHDHTLGPVTDQASPHQLCAKRQRCLDSNSRADVATAVYCPAAAAVADTPLIHCDHAVGVADDLGGQTAAAVAPASFLGCANGFANGFEDPALSQAGCVEGCVADDAAAGGSVVHCTNLHSVEGWGLVACEVIEDFDGDDGD